MKMDARRLQVACDVVREHVEKKEIPAGVLAVANRHETLRCEAFSRSEGDQVCPDSLFMIASITKPIVATAVMRLVEAGRLVLSEPVSRYIPEFAQPDKAPVTAWNLLTHTSDMEETAWRDALTVSRSPASFYLQAMYRSTLHSEPGTRFRYNSLAFYVLAEMISRLSGVAYPEYLRKHIFEPLGMIDTAFDPGPERKERAAPVHGMDEDFVRYFQTLCMPGGGLWSSAADLIRFGQAYLNGGLHGDYHLLAPATIELMTHDHTGRYGFMEVVEGRSLPVHRGLGWDKSSASGYQPGSVHGFGHNGATGGRLWVDPEYDLVFVFLMNDWNSKNHMNYTAKCALQAVYGALR